MRHQPDRRAEPQQTLVDATLLDRLTDELAGTLDGLETIRQAAQAQIRQRILIVIGAVVAVGLLGYLIGGGGILWIAIPVVVAGIGGSFWASRPYGAFKDEAAEALIPPICSALGGLTYTRKVMDFPGAHRFTKTGVVGSYNRSSFKDLFEGSHRDTAFRVVFARLRRRSQRTSGSRSRSSTTTVFRGLLFSIAVPRHINGEILIARDAGGMGNTLGGWIKSFGAMNRVNFDHADFEDRFEVYAKNPDVAREVLVPSLLDTFCAIDDMVGRRGMQAAFDGQDFLMAVRTKTTVMDEVAVGRPIGHPRAVIGGLADQVTVAHRIIDLLHGG